MAVYYDNKRVFVKNQAKVNHKSLCLSLIFQRRTAEEFYYFCKLLFSIRRHLEVPLIRTF